MPVKSQVAEPNWDLRTFALFRDVDDEPLTAVIAGARRLSLSDGETLLVSGQRNNHLYILLSGRMAALLPGDLSQRGMVIQPGEAIGEMSLLDGRRTSANVVAQGVCEVLAIEEAVFWRELAPLPGLLRNMTRLVIQRMRANSDRLVQSMAEQLKLEHLRKELGAARDIQMGLLPHRTPLFPDHPQVDAYGYLLPAKEVGGDLYDAFAIDHQHLLLAVGDVSGKGMPAALFMMRTLTLLRSLASNGVPDDTFLPTLNRLLMEGNDADMFVTLCVAVLRVSDGQLTLYNGGHPACFLAREGGPFETLTGAKGALLGIMPAVRFVSKTVNLAPGDRLVVYSDGVTEAENPAMTMYGERRALADLGTAPIDAGCADLVQGLVRGVSRFADGAEQSDDITILALHYHGSARFGPKYESPVS